jgi:8-amino-7-oxononanoate synthase
MSGLAAALGERRRRQLYRERATLEGPQGVEVRIDGRQYLSFCSNDYLGLAAHPELVAAFKQGAERFGVGSGAAHLLSGHSYAHQALEEDLAAYVNRPRALLFSTGYMANLGVLCALTARGDSVLQDRLNHASLLDAARLSGAKLLRYRHLDIESVTRRLTQTAGGTTLIATDGVFSMDGDRAPLGALAGAAAEHAAWLLVDDAHGFGVWGREGAGWCVEQLPEPEERVILMATLGKALGTFGAFVAGSEALVETLIQHARSFIYTTAPPPALAWATRTALRLARDGEHLRARLTRLIQCLRQGADQLDLPLLPSATPIQPLLVGGSGAALRLSEALRRRGILVPAIRPPTVPQGAARLRITLSAVHSEAQLARLLDALAASYGEACAAH